MVPQSSSSADDGRFLPLPSRPWPDQISRPRQQYPWPSATVTETEQITTTLIVAAGWPITATDSAVSIVSAASPWSSGITDRPFKPPFRHGLSSAAVGAAAVFGSLAFLSVVVGLVLLCCKMSRKRRRSGQEQTQKPEMIKQTTQMAAFVDDARANPPQNRLNPFLISPPSIGSTQPLFGQNREAPPVLLSTNMNQNYNTGIETSDTEIDAIDSGSITGFQRRMTQGCGYASSITEPPPPYRPGSMLSRDNSWRQSTAPPSYRPRTLMTQTVEPIRSPFGDPEGDDSVSDLDGAEHETTDNTRSIEEMSQVSELSYQQGPAIPHHNI